MKRLLVCLTLSMLMGLPMPSLAQESEEEAASSEALTEQIDELIRGLGDQRFSVRTNSEQELTKIGRPAVDPLRKAAESADRETRIRASRLLRRLMRTLTLADVVSESGLEDVTSVVISRSGRFAYAAAYRNGAISFYSREPETGKLSHVQTISDQDVMGGAVSLRLSPDQRFAVAACFGSKSLALFRIDQNTGTLDRVQVVDGVGEGAETRMSWPIEAVFSLDSKFVYAIDSSYDGQGALIVLKVEDGTLKWVETNVGDANCFRGARGIAMHPHGTSLYVAADESSTLTVVDRDPATGKTSVRATYADETEGIHGLGGVFSVACSPDGRFVYTSSGRFQGDDTVSVFATGADGTLSVVQEIANGLEGLDGFRGGNEIIVTPDGKYVYAAATRSSMVAGFRRHVETGKLTVLDTESIDLSEPGTLGPAGLGISPDGKFLYVAAESPGKIVVFKRRTIE